MAGSGRALANSRTDTWAPAVAIAAALWAAGVGLAYGTFAVGGSDSACYLSEARLLASGTTRIDEPLARIAPWPASTLTFTPAGHMPSPVAPGVIVPICPPGLPLAMAGFRTIGLSEWLVVPLLGGLAIWLTFLIGRQIDGPLTGAAAAVLTAASPIFLYQVVQPMTDVPAAAWWLLVVFLAIGGREETGLPFTAGLAASIAVLTRPNLLPLAVVVVAYLEWVAVSTGAHVASVARVRQGLRAGALFAIGLLPGLVALGWLQRAMYGSPLANGYGALGGLFASSHVVPNLMRYTQWLIGTHTPFLALAVAAPMVRRGAGAGRAPVWLCLALAAGTFTAYLPYVEFDAWWYIRFLLPAIPLLMVLSVMVLVALLQRVAPTAYRACTAITVVALAAWCVSEPEGRIAFALQRMEHHFVEAGTFVAERLPARAAVVTVKYSGSVHYYSGRPTLAWDTLDAARLEPAFQFLRDQGYEPYLLLATEEEQPFRARFKTASATGDLDWPPIARIGRAARVYDPRDRARFLAGDVVPTEDVENPPRRGTRR